MNKNHNLKSEQSRVSEELALQEGRVRDAGDWFMKISGQKIPAGGFVVVGGVYDSPERVNRVVIKSLSDRDVTKS